MPCRSFIGQVYLDVATGLLLGLLHRLCSGARQTFRRYCWLSFEPRGLRWLGAS